MSQALLFDVEPTPAPEPDERYTLRETLDWCKRKAKVEAFDLDVAACAEAHCAPRYFTTQDDGLKQPWSGRVWCNPPYSDIEPWVLKAWDERPHCERIAMLLPANRTEQPWWQKHVELCRDAGASTLLQVDFLPGRQKFGIPGNPLGMGMGSPPFGVVLLTFWPR